MTVGDDDGDVWHLRACSVVRREQLGPHAIQSVVDVRPSHACRELGVRVDGRDEAPSVRVRYQIPANYRPVSERQQTHLKQQQEEDLFAT